MRDISQSRLFCGAIALLSAILCLAPVQQSVATTATDAFDDGNRLFRDDLYWAALLRYREAREAGMNTPLLHYNTGIAHYRAKQHIRARVSLLKAVESPGLRVISQFNLGLNAYAAGDIDDALDWFRQARDQEERLKIRKLAIIAISRLLAEKRESDPLLARIEKRQEKRAYTIFKLRARVGFGSDDNVFRAPYLRYVDFSDPNLPLVTPEIMSGAFIPIDLHAKYSINSFEYESFYAAYRIAGRYYQDKELSNANEFSHEIRLGSEYRRKKEHSERRIFSAFTFAQHIETYYDPDDGAARTSNGGSIDDRMNYIRYGPEITLQQSFDRLAIGLRFKGQLWNYEETTLVPEYDHEYFAAGANIQYRFTSTSLLRMTVDWYSRRYGDRPSFDLDGQQLITNPTVRYDYTELGLTARQRITSNMWFGFNYKHTIRIDTFVGYNDYTRDSYGADFHWSPGTRFKLDVGTFYRIYNYPNAFAFHNPVAGLKTLESVNGNIAASFRMTPQLSLVAEAILFEYASTDSRIAYDRKFFSIGVTWHQ